MDGISVRPTSPFIPESVPLFAQRRGIACLTPRRCWPMARRRSPSHARDLLVAYFEETKPTLIQRTERRAADHGVTLRRSTFNQAVVSPAILQASVASSGRAGGFVRPVREDDVAELGRLLDRVARRHPLSFTMSADRLRHHVLSLPQGRSYLVEEQGVPAAFITFYQMDTLSASGPSRVVVVELLINDGMREASCLLLDQALSYARSLTREAWSSRTPPASTPRRANSAGSSHRRDAWSSPRARAYRRSNATLAFCAMSSDGRVTLPGRGCSGGETSLDVRACRRKRAQGAGCGS